MRLRRVAHVSLAKILKKTDVPMLLLYSARQCGELLRLSEYKKAGLYLISPASF